MKKGIIASIVLGMCILLAIIMLIPKKHANEEVCMVMGGTFCVQDDYVKENAEKDKNDKRDDKEDNNKENNNKEDNDNEGPNPLETGEQYFRPSNMPVLNTTMNIRLIDRYFGKKLNEITIPSEFRDTPEHTVLNYFSILREAANPTEDKSAGCGSIGMGKNPYPIAYQFLTSKYQGTLAFDEYVKTFENILHMSLVKYHVVPVNSKNESEIRYFVELECIEGTERNQGVFAYYYGFVDLAKENDGYRISNLSFTGENYLCAPYHGWYWSALPNVEARYGYWCHMIKKMGELQRDGYLIRVPFLGNDGYEYCIVFFELTNSTDIEVAQYRREDGGEWKFYYMSPEECIKN